MAQKIEISYKTVVFTVLFLISLYLVVLLRDVIVGVFISVLVATALNPIVTKLENYKIPRSVSIVLIYVLSISLLVTIIATVVPPLIDQTNNLLKTIPIETISQKFHPFEGSLQDIQVIANQLGSVKTLVRAVTSTFSGIIAIFTFMVITYYLLMERKNLPTHLQHWFRDESTRKKAADFVYQLELQIGSWVRGELSLMFIVGFLTYIGLVLLNIPYAIPLAILAGLLELIPNLGPTISAIPAIIVALLASANPFMVIFVIVLYIFVQQLENNIIVPKVMNTALGLHPLVTILSIIIGLTIDGISGGILAVPVFLLLKVVYGQLIGSKLISPRPSGIL